eukprot:TRINITY_DN95194_c0_g1_i1.p1 TRINITY_DN95194_c0_g1~~TRINITY_DN95194_c0_g1_i1.p1  ORF type:complete len:172 (+),score=31.20 TRINITY_DN95194_c0_g1_i1:63-518(+)
MVRTFRGRGLCALLAAALAASTACQTFIAGNRLLQPGRGRGGLIPAASLSAAEVTPLGNQVLIEEIEEPEETGGLLLSEGSKKKTRLRLGRVQARGKGTPGDMREPPLLEALQEGDTVLWEDFSNRRLEDSPDNKLFLVPIRSVKAKVSGR